MANISWWLQEFIVATVYYNSHLNVIRVSTRNLPAKILTVFSPKPSVFNHSPPRSSILFFLKDIATKLLQLLPHRIAQIRLHSAHTRALHWHTVGGVESCFDVCYLEYKMYVCTICDQFRGRSFAAVLRHIGAVHRYDSGLSVRCGVRSCPETYTKFESFWSYIYSKHRDVLHLDLRENGAV